MVVWYGKEKMVTEGKEKAIKKAINNYYYLIKM